MPFLLVQTLPLTAQTKWKMQNHLLALKDSNAPRKALSDQLVDRMMATAKATSVIVLSRCRNGWRSHGLRDMPLLFARR